MRNSLIYWNWLDPEGKLLSTEEIEVEYDILGKGALVYHWALKPETDWDLIGDHYQTAGENIKVIIKKR
jgi:hypothetical protein